MKNFLKFWLFFNYVHKLLLLQNRQNHCSTRHFHVKTGINIMLVQLVGTFKVLNFFRELDFFYNIQKVFDYRVFWRLYFRYQWFIIDDKLNITRRYITHQSTTPSNQCSTQSAVITPTLPWLAFYHYVLLFFYNQL